MFVWPRRPRPHKGAVARSPPRPYSPASLGARGVPGAIIMRSIMSPFGRARAAGLATGCAALLFVPALTAAAAPRVQRVEPPGWWAGHSHNPVRLLVTGASLQGASLTGPPGFTVNRVSNSSNGQYLFADLHLPAHAPTGTVPLRVTTPAGETSAAFEILAPRDARANFLGFSPDDVIYLIMIDRFANGDPTNDDPPVSAGLHDRRKARYYHGGDLRGIINRLDYLRDLGVTALWLTPWYDNVNHLNRRETYTANNELSKQGEPITDYHGYGAVDFYAVEERFGDLATLRELVQEARRHGLKVIQDQVANHTGPYHPWATNPPTPTWFNGCPTNHLANTWQTWTIAHTNPPPDKLKATLEGWFINILPDLNQNDPEVSTYLIQNSLWWVGITGLDAVRQDTLPYVPRTHWARWTAALKCAHPNLTILGEMWDGDPKLVSFFQGGQARFDGVDSGIETLFDFPLHYALLDVFARGHSMTRLTDTLAADALYVNPSGLVPFLGLHDTPRFLSEPGATPAGMKLAFTYLFTTRGTPLLYYGDEIGLRGGKDPHNRAPFPGGWPDDPRNAFTADGRTPEQAALHNHVRKLLTLRRELAPLRRGNLVPLHTAHSSHAFARTLGEDTVLVAFNNSARSQLVELDLAPLQLTAVQSWTDRLGRLGNVSVQDHRLRLGLPPHSAALLTPRRAAPLSGVVSGDEATEH